MGQLAAQLPPSEQSDSVRGEDLHDSVCVPGGQSSLPSTALNSAFLQRLKHVDMLTLCLFFRSWTTASSLPSSPKTSAWSSTPETPRSHHLAPSGTCLGADTPRLQTGREPLSLLSTVRRPDQMYSKRT